MKRQGTNNLRALLLRADVLFLLLLLFCALFAPLLANNKPLIAKVNGELSFPAFSSSEAGRFSYAERESYDLSIWPLIPYAPGRPDLVSSSYAAPGSKPDSQHATHWLGTNKIGEDVAANLIYGARSAALIGLGAMLISLCIGLIFGVIGGYFGNDGLRIGKFKLLLSIPVFYLAFHLAFIARSDSLIRAMERGGWIFTSQLLFCAIIFMTLPLIFHLLTRKFGVFSKAQIRLPIDHLLSRFLELFVALPRLIVLISLSAIMKPGLLPLILILGLFGWTGIARYTRAETLKLRESSFISFQKLLGLPFYQIMFRHVLPLVIGPALVSFAFGVAGTILTESALSFLGIGVPDEVQTWGKLLSQARDMLSAWWLVLIPGFLIFLTVLSVNSLASHFKSRWSPDTV